MTNVEAEIPPFHSPKFQGWFFYVDLLTKRKNKCKQCQYDQNNIKHYYTMPSDGLDIKFFLWVNNIKERDTVYALHQKNDGTWEIIPALVEYTAANGPEITVHVNSLSPIAIVKVMSDGSIKTLKEKAINSPENDGQSTTGNNQKKSPKTGVF